MKIVLLAVLLGLACSATFQSHNYWYTAVKSGATSGVPYADIPWGYCDMKCTYLEKYFPNYDFFVINFNKGTLSANFAACYVLAPGSGSTAKLWNTVAGANSFYDSLCGGDSDDWLTTGTANGQAPTYTVVSKEGVGIGTEISY